MTRREWRLDTHEEDGDTRTKKGALLGLLVATLGGVILATSVISLVKGDNPVWGPLEHSLAWIVGLVLLVLGLTHSSDG